MLKSLFSRLTRWEYFPLLRGSVMMFTARIVGAVLILVAQAFLARTMGAHELGIYAFTFSCAVMVSLMSGLGYAPACIPFIGRYLANDDRPRMKGYIRRGRQIVLSTGLAVTAIGTIMILWDPWQLSPDYRYPLLIAMVSAPVFGLVYFHTALSNAFHWHNLAFLPNMVARPLLFLIALWVMWAAGSKLTAADAILLHITIVVFLSLAQFVWLNRSLIAYTSAVKPKYETRAWTRVALPLTIGQIFNQYFQELAIVLSGLYLSSSDLGIMNAGFRIALVIAFGIIAFDSVTFPRVSKLYAKGDKAGLQRMITRTTQIKFWAALVALAVLVLWGKSFLSLFGQEFVRGYATLVIIAAAQLFLAAIGPVGPLLSTTGYQDECLYVYAGSLTVMLVLMHLVAPVFGMDGAAVVVLITMLLRLIWMYALVVRHLGIKPSIVSFGRLLP